MVGAEVKRPVLTVQHTDLRPIEQDGQFRHGHTRLPEVEESSLVEGRLAALHLAATGVSTQLTLSGLGGVALLLADLVMSLVARGRSSANS